MFNVLGPSLALNVDEHSLFWICEVNHDIWRLVAGLVQEGIILGVNARIRVVLNGTQMFFVRVMLTLAGDLDVARREASSLRPTTGLLRVRLGSPTVDLCNVSFASVRLGTSFISLCSSSSSSSS